MRIGYFGGSFDPPHLGHLAVARAVRDRFQLDRVLLAPTGRQPLKPGGPQAPYTDRLRMTELLCAGEPGLEASSIDAPQPDGAPNYTVDTLRRLRQTLTPADNLFAIAGADSFLTLPKWRDAPELLRLAEWIVVSRPGFPLERLNELQLTPAERARVHQLQDVDIPISATELRHRLQQHRNHRDLVPSAVLAYIETACLYGAAGD